MADSEIIATEILGKIKWFNNKSGYGFITATTGDFLEKDIFVHHSAIRVTNTQYKYLVQGEYVQFDLVKSNNGNHEFQAANVTGVNNGELMCETRRNSRNEKLNQPETDGANGDEKENTSAERKPSISTRSRSRPISRIRDKKPVNSNKVELAVVTETTADEGGDFKKVEKKRKPRGPRPRPGPGTNKDKNV